MRSLQGSSGVGTLPTSKRVPTGPQKVSPFPIGIPRGRLKLETDRENRLIAQTAGDRRSRGAQRFRLVRGLSLSEPSGRSSPSIAFSRQSAYREMSEASSPTRASSQSTVRAGSTHPPFSTAGFRRPGSNPTSLSEVTHVRQ